MTDHTQALVGLYERLAAIEAELARLRVLARVVAKPVFPLYHDADWWARRL